jgi:hypothetical protein
MKTLTKLALAALLVAATATSSHALLITAGVTPAVAFGDDNGQAAIDAIIAPIVGSTLADYKDNKGGVEEGSFQGSYNTTYNIVGLTSESFQIAYTGGSAISGGPIYLLVKDGNASPNWYLYNITGWNGTDAIQGQGFFPAQGGISHVAIYGNGTSVPDGGTTLLLLGAACGFVGCVRRKLN